MGAGRPLVIDEVRMLAWNFLQRIEHSEVFTDLHLESAFSKNSPLRPLDRAFILELVLGTLRWRSRLDGAILRAAKFPGKKIDPRLLHLLRLGAYQILFMDRVPHSAAVNESVRLARAVFKNEKISGKFIRFEKSQFGVVVALDTKKIPLGVVLTDFFATVYNKLKIGSKVEIEYLGLQKRTKLYSVKVNGKPLERAGGDFGRPATAKELKEYFTTPID